VRRGLGPTARAPKLDRTAGVDCSADAAYGGAFAPAQHDAAGPI
jgi:hypothetical protein